jgi:serine protease Do
MKSKHSKFITAGLAAAMIYPAFALEGQEDDAPPPPSVATEPTSLPQFKLPSDQTPEAPTKEVATTNTAFLGVVSGPVPAILAEHLDLKIDGGILVRAVTPDSPAELAGIVINDIITKVSGTTVKTAEEFSKLITSNKPGQSVDLEIVHKGKPVRVPVTLGNRPANFSMTEPLRLDQMNLDGLPRDMADHIRDAIGGMEFKLGGDLDSLSPQMDEAIREIQKRMRNGQSALDLLPKAGREDATTASHSSATIRMMDNEGSVEVQSNDGSKEVTVRDPQNNVVWSGKWNTEEERAAAPDNVRRRMENLHLDTESGGSALKFKFHGKPGR